ncbi:Olfactory receptor 6C2 [Manis javanica]|nr:Olfactory receptor 6C2 [Manis javanica]
MIIKPDTQQQRTNKISQESKESQQKVIYLLDSYNKEEMPVNNLASMEVIKTILRFPSAQQRKRGCSTFSHMTVVSITYGKYTFIYVKPSAKDSVAIINNVMIEKRTMRQTFSDSFRGAALPSKKQENVEV